MWGGVREKKILFFVSWLTEIDVTSLKLRRSIMSSRKSRKPKWVLFRRKCQNRVPMSAFMRVTSIALLFQTDETTNATYWTTCAHFYRQKIHWKGFWSVEMLLYIALNGWNFSFSLSIYFDPVHDWCINEWPTTAKKGSVDSACIDCDLHS